MSLVAKNLLSKSKYLMSSFSLYYSAKPLLPVFSSSNGNLAHSTPSSNKIRAGKVPAIPPVPILYYLATLSNSETSTSINYSLEVEYLYANFAHKE